MDDNSQNKLGSKQEVESRFHLILTLTIFFPVLLSAFLGTAKMDEEQVSFVTSQWTTLVGSFLLAYVFFALAKNKLSAGLIALINSLLLISIALFICPILLLTTSDPSKPVSGLLNYISLLGSLYGLPLVPILLIILLSVGSIKYLIKKRKRITT